MDAATKARILDLARWAPNIDNAQPFHFRWNGDRLLVLRDAGRDRTRGNAGNLASYVGLGCLLEYMRIAASEAGWQAEFELPEDGPSADGPWATAGIAPGPTTQDELLPGLRLRASDRREYRGGSLDDPVFAELASDVQRVPACRLYLVEQVGPDLMNYLLEADALIWKDQHLMPEMLSWVRWSDAEADRTRDGVPWQSLGVSFLLSRLMYLLSKSAALLRLARRSGGPQRQQQEHLRALISSSAALGCFTAQEATPGALVQVGRAFVRAWLRLNLAGYGVQVMALPALHALQHALGILPEDIPADCRRTFATGREVLTRAFGAPSETYPVWMFRTGLSPPIPKRTRTRRRALGDWVPSTEQL